MSTITLHLPPDTEKRLRNRASERGQTVEAYLEQLVEDEVAKAPETGGAATVPFPRYISQPVLTDEEFRQLMRELASGPPVPAAPARLFSG